MDNTQITKQARPGRKMTPGKIVFNPHSQTFGVFMGYCTSCNNKFIYERSELPKMVGYYRKTNRTWKVRTLRYIQRKLEASQ